RCPRPDSAASARGVAPAARKAGSATRSTLDPAPTSAATSSPSPSTRFAPIAISGTGRSVAKGSGPRRGARATHRVLVVDHVARPVELLNIAAVFLGKGEGGGAHGGLDLRGIVGADHRRVDQGRMGDPAHRDRRRLDAVLLRNLDDARRDRMV